MLWVGDVDKAYHGEIGCFPMTWQKWEWGGRDKCSSGLQYSSPWKAAVRGILSFSGAQCPRKRVDSTAEPHHKVADKGPYRLWQMLLPWVGLLGDLRRIGV